MLKVTRIIHALAFAGLAASCATVAPSTPTVMPPPVAAQPPSLAERAGESCRTAVAATAARGIDETSVIKVETSRAGAGVRIKLKGAERPWSCIVGPDGAVKNVMYMGEG